MKDIHAVKGKFLIQRLIEEGEHEHQDFKFAISDARKIARSISAFANNDGGHLLIGVKDNGKVAGVRNEEDIYVVEQAAQSYCTPAQEIKVKAYIAEGGAVVMKVDIEASAVRPVMVREAEGKMKAYYRVNDENIVAHPLMVKIWRKAAADNGMLLELSHGQRALLDLIDEEKQLTFERYLHRAHVSQALGEEIVTCLGAAGIIKLAYNGTEFVITAAD